ncbi:MAG: pantetheine-phosphate adenylyltransferase [Actinobacteria bacterium]|nr:pantetheine-phosphate adenylyltransferase [Actinomycetota bacterium]
MRIAVCPGSFDPITLGHLDVVRRALTMFDEVVVAVATNDAKVPLLAADVRVELARQVVADLPRVRVGLVHGLLAEYVKEQGACAVVKGIRGASDVDAEIPMALMNRHLSGVETVFVAGDQSLAHIASSMVKDIARHGGRIDDLVPEPVVGAVRAALAERGGAR